MDSLVHQQLTLYFVIGTGLPANDNEEDAWYDAHRSAFALIDAGVSRVPGWFRTVDDNGFPAEEGMRIAPVSLCEFDVEVTEVDGKLAWGVTFHSDGQQLPQDVARALKEFCLEQYRKAAGCLPVEFAKARQHNEWCRRESIDWPEPL